MKKYLLIFTIGISLALIACDTSSKMSTTQTLTTAPPPPTETLTTTPPATDSSGATPLQPVQLKKAFVKKVPGVMERQPMTPEERHKALQGPPEVPTKKQ